MSFVLDVVISIFALICLLLIILLTIRGILHRRVILYLPGTTGNITKLEFRRTKAILLGILYLLICVVVFKTGLLHLLDLLIR
jgi:hypothetical protein